MAMHPSLSTALCRRLGVALPIVQAPMAGGWTTPALVAAVANAGGLGMLAAARVSAAELRAQVETVRAATDRPFGVNFLLAPPDPAPRDAGEMQRVLDQGRARFGLPAGPALLRLSASQLAEQLAYVSEARIPIVGFAMGDPAPFVARIKEHGAFVIAMATSVDDALRLEASGADAIVAQGSEAGGHRSVLDGASGADPPLVGTLALVPQVVDAVRVPVIAAGGIMDGRGVFAALSLGAQAAQLGTRFLLARESGAFAAYRRRLCESTETDTVMTLAISGRPARALRNALVRAVDGGGAPALPWPYQALAADDLYRAAVGAGDTDWAPLLAGQGLRLARAEASAAEIVESLVSGVAATRERWSVPLSTLPATH
jgi:nitronate monooxygenase